MLSEEDRTLLKAPPLDVFSKDRNVLKTRPHVCLSVEDRNPIMNIYISLSAIKTGLVRLNEKSETKINQINQNYPALELAELVGVTVPSAG